MLKQAKAILKHRTFLVIGTLLFLIAGIHQGSRWQNDVGGALLNFEVVCALVGGYIGFSLQRLLRTHHSPTIPGFVGKHLVTAFASQVLIVVLCVAGASSFATNYIAMFAVLWGWSLAWCCAGYLGRTSLILTFWLNVLLIAVFYVRLGSSFLALVQSSFSWVHLLFLVADCAVVVLMVVWIRRPRGGERSAVSWARKNPPNTSGALDDVPYFLEQRPWSRIRQLGLSLQPDYWPASLLMTAAVLIWGRYRGWGFSTSNFGPIYVWCFMLCYFMLGQGVFTRNRVRSLFPLPVSRHTLIRDYGLTLFLSCARRWCGFVFVAWFAVRVPLPGFEPLSPPAIVWVYCAGILLIMFGLRALVGSWNDRLLFRMLAVWPIVLYASFSDELPMSPVLALSVGFGLMTTAYWRWQHVEME